MRLFWNFFKTAGWIAAIHCSFKGAKYGEYRKYQGRIVSCLHREIFHLYVNQNFFTCVFFEIMFMGEYQVYCDHWVLIQKSTSCRICGVARKTHYPRIVSELLICNSKMFYMRLFARLFFPKTRVFCIAAIQCSFQVPQYRDFVSEHAFSVSYV